MDPVTQALMRVQGMPRFAAAAMAKEANPEERKAISDAISQLAEKEPAIATANPTLKTTVKAIIERHAEEQKASVDTDFDPPSADPESEAAPQDE